MAVTLNKRANWTVELTATDPDTGAARNLGRWAVLEGGGVTSEDATYHDWDGEVRMGGVRSREDITLRRGYGRHAAPAYRVLDSWVGRARVVLSRVATDDRGVTIEEPVTYTGILSGAKLPDVEKGSSEAGEIELTIQADADLA